MGVRILHDRDQNMAVMYCSTSDFAFGPVFGEAGGYDADERALSFVRWLDATPLWCSFEKLGPEFGRRDARSLTDSALESAYGAWMAQEKEQWAAEEARADAAERLRGDYLP